MGKLEGLQGCRAHKELPPSRTLPKDYAYGPSVVQVEGQFLMSEVPLQGQQHFKRRVLVLSHRYVSRYGEAMPRLKRCPLAPRPDPPPLNASKLITSSTQLPRLRGRPVGTAAFETGVCVILCPVAVTSARPNIGAIRKIGTSLPNAPCTSRRLCCPTRCASYWAPCQPLWQTCFKTCFGVGIHLLQLGQQPGAAR